MWRVLRDLLRTNRAFAAGAVLLGIVVAMALLSFVSPYPPNDAYVVPPDMPPSWAYPLGTNSRGQDVFWQLSVAIRNTLMFGITVAFISRCLSLVIGLIAGYVGRADRPPADVVQRHLHRHPAVPDPGDALLRAARPHVVAAAGAGHGLPGLGLRRAADPLGGDEPAHAASSPRPRSSPA